MRCTILNRTNVRVGSTDTPAESYPGTCMVHDMAQACTTVRAPLSADTLADSFWTYSKPAQSYTTVPLSADTPADIPSPDARVDTFWPLLSPKDIIKFNAACNSVSALEQVRIKIYNTSLLFK